MKRNNSTNSLADGMDPKDYFILSKDFLRHLPIDQELTEGWKNHPPLIQKKNFLHELKLRVRGGIPPAIRCAIWITCVVRTTKTPQYDEKAIQEYGTLGKVQTLDHGWDLILSQLFPDASDEADALLPHFGLGQTYLDQLLNGVDDGSLEKMPLKSLTRVLGAIQHHLGLEYCPFLPHLATVLLRSMSESYTYHTLREMVHTEPTRFVPVSEAQHYAWCKTFSDMLKRMYPKTAREMEQINALSPEGLDPIFKRFFSPVLRHEHVIRIMDLYMFEGSKVLFRIGLSLLANYKKELKRMNITTTTLWWAEIRTLTHSPTFDFDALVKRAYGFHGSRIRKRIKFPRRRTISRMIKVREQWAEDNMEFDIIFVPPKPMGFVDHHSDNNDKPKMVLAKPASVRSSLASWLPSSLRSCKMELLYSTNAHGRSLDMFYNKVSKTKRTVMLIEVLGVGCNSGSSNVIGMYASQAWHRSNQIYGDGECFLFTFMCGNVTGDSNSTCYKWRPKSAGSVDDEKTEALMEQFMLSKDSFIAMGGNKNGSSGLRLNKDFTRGESATAMGFDNAPLAGKVEEFEVGLVEVYRFVRAMDGHGVDGEDDEIWNLG